MAYSLYYDIMFHVSFWLNSIVLLATLIVMAIWLRLQGGFVLVGYAAMLLLLKVLWYIRHSFIKHDWLSWDSFGAVFFSGACELTQLLASVLLLVFAVVVAVTRSRQAVMPPLPAVSVPPRDARGA